MTPESKLSVLHRYALEDARAAGGPAPDAHNVQEMYASMAQSGDVLFLPGDPNLDNQKRNLAIRAFLEFELNDMISFGRNWCEQQAGLHGDAPWLREWKEIVNRADPDELVDILLSHDENRVRQRISMPYAEMLDFMTVLRVKRREFA